MVPFHPFTEAHLAAIGVILLVTAGFTFIGRNKYLPWVIAGVLVGSELSEAGIAIYNGHWRAAWALPLQICDLSLYALVIALLWKNQIAWELAYYWGLGGSIPAVITPAIPFDFPYYIFITFFIHHGGIIAGSVYLASLRIFPLPPASLKRIWLITHAYAMIIFLYNWAMGTNYLFLSSKPSQPSILDYLGPWPVYLLGLEALFLATIFLLYFLYRKPLN